MRLSLCIATYKRAGFIGETIESILPQMTPETELLIVDGASPDDTERVVHEYISRYPFIRYFREEENSGVDGDYDKAVGYATGEYCWLLPDDDLVAPGAVQRVLEVLEEEPDLLIVDASVMDVSFERLLLPRKLPFTGLRRYTAADADKFMEDVIEILSFIGCTIIRREVWLERDRQSYYGSYFVHAGVVFQQPPEQAIILGESLITIRYGNSMWTPHRFKIWAFNWPQLISGAQGYSAEIKQKLVPRPPWRELSQMVSFRARGAYDYAQFRKFFAAQLIGPWKAVLLLLAVVPGKLLHVLGTAYFVWKGQLKTPTAYELVRCSPNTNRISRWLARRGGHMDQPL